MPEFHGREPFVGPREHVGRRPRQQLAQRPRRFQPRAAPGGDFADQPRKSTQVQCGTPERLPPGAAGEGSVERSRLRGRQEGDSAADDGLPAERQLVQQPQRGLQELRPSESPRPVLFDGNGEHERHQRRRVRLDRFAQPPGRGAVPAVDAALHRQAAARRSLPGVLRPDRIGVHSPPRLSAAAGSGARRSRGAAAVDRPRPLFEARSRRSVQDSLVPSAG